LPSRVGKPCPAIYTRGFSAALSLYRLSGKMLEPKRFHRSPQFPAATSRLELDLLVQSCCPEAEGLIAPVPVTAASPTATSAAMPAATAVPAASFGDLLMVQLLGAQVATAAPALATFSPASAANISAPASWSAGGKKAGAAPIAASKVFASPPVEKKSGASAGLASAAANMFAMPAVAPQLPTVGNAWHALATQINSFRGDEGSGDDLPVDWAPASPVSSAISVPQSLVSAPVSAPLDTQISALPATSDAWAGERTGDSNGEARKIIKGASQAVPASSGNSLRRGDAVAALSANAAWPMPVSIATDAPPVEMPPFTQSANQSSGSQNAGQLFAAPASDGDCKGQSSYRSWRPSPVISPLSPSAAAGRRETEDVSSTAKGLAASLPMIGNPVPAYAEQSAEDTAASRPFAAVPQGAATAVRSTASFFTGLYSPPARAEAVATSATPSAAESDPGFSAGQASQPAISSPDTSRPASAAAAPAMLQNEMLPSWPMRAGSTAPTSTAGAGVTTVPSLRGPEENFHSTDSVDRDQPVAPAAASETQTPSAAPANAPLAATLRPAPAELAGGMRTGITAQTGTPQTSAAGAAACPNPIDASDRAQAKVTAEVSPARFNRTVPAPAASAANPTANETASASVSVMVPGQPVSPPDAGIAVQSGVAAPAPAGTVASAPQHFANPAPAKAASPASASALAQVPAAPSSEAIGAKPSGTSGEFRAAASNPAAASAASAEANPAPAPAEAPSTASGQAASATASAAEEAQDADSEVTVLADPLASATAGLNPGAPGNVNTPENIAPGNGKTGPPLSAAAPSSVSRKTGAQQAKPSSPAAADSSNQTQRPSSLTSAGAIASQDQDKAQPPAAASEHSNQPAAAIAAQPVPLAEGRQSPSHSDAVNKGNQAQAASGNIPREADSAPTPIVVQSARVLERMGQAEMRVGMNTADFGNLELRASVSQDRVGASIATAHAELRAALMAEMPSLERSMEQHQLRLDLLDLGAHSGGGNQERGASAQQQPRSQSGGEAGFATTSSSSSSGDAVPSPEGPAPSAWSAPYSSGLNVHA